MPKRKSKGNGQRPQRAPVAPLYPDAVLFKDRIPLPEKAKGMIQEKLNALAAAARAKAQAERDLGEIVRAVSIGMGIDPDSTTEKWTLDFDQGVFVRRGQSSSEHRTIPS